MSLEKKIVITGCTKGLGLAWARFFKEKGHVVLGCGRSRELIEGLDEEFGEPHLFQVVDVASNESVREWAEHVLTSYEAPDLLINNAAVMNPVAPLWEISSEDFDRVIDVNLKGVANVIRHFVPAMVARGKGVIVNLSSGWGRSVDSKVAPYCTTKWGVEGMTKALAEELPQGMAAVALNPGIINTEMLRLAWGEGAVDYPAPEEWVREAGPLVLKLGAKDNGRSV